jgi:hypothetical protein
VGVLVGPDTNKDDAIFQRRIPAKKAKIAVDVADVDVVIGIVQPSLLL